MEYFIKKAGLGHNGNPLVALFHSFSLSEELSFSSPQELHGLWIQFPLLALKFLKKNQREARKGGSQREVVRELGVYGEARKGGSRREVVRELGVHGEARKGGSPKGREQGVHMLLCDSGAQ